MKSKSQCPQIQLHWHTATCLPLHIVCAAFKLNSRIVQLRQKPHSLQNPEYLQSNTLQKKSVRPWARSTVEWSGFESQLHPLHVTHSVTIAVRFIGGDMYKALRLVPCRCSTSISSSTY